MQLFRRFFLCLIIVTCFFPSTSYVRAFSAIDLIIKPVSFLQQASETVSRRLSDILFYLYQQKKYTFDGYSDPNDYNNWIIPPDLEQKTIAIKAGDLSGVWVSTTSSLTDITVKTNSVSASSSLIFTDTPITASTTSTSSEKIKPPTIVSSSSTKIQTKAPPKNSTVGAPIKTNVSFPEIDKLVSDIKNSVKKESVNILPGVVKVETDLENSSESGLGGDIIKYTNFEREKEDLNNLSQSTLLDQVALFRTNDLFDEQYFEHISPSGQTVSVVAKNYGYQYVLIGENLAMGNFDSDKSIVDAWMESPGHRANILKPEYEEIGVAAQEGDFDGKKVTIAVQVFGKSSSSCQRPADKTKTDIENSTDIIKEMQEKALVMYSDLEKIKNSPNVDLSYYNQKVAEYNYFAKIINDAVIVLKNVIISYNNQIGAYNKCISI